MKRVLVTGGCGFIGANLALERLRRGDAVRLLDNCLRSGSEQNLRLLERQAESNRLAVVPGDIRDPERVEYALRDVDLVFHLAAQVAVTTSIAEPRADFEVNALGTLNVLEAARRSPRPPIVVYASTNKVYGSLDRLEVRLEQDHYILPDAPHGVNEDFLLDLHSPYGCSKGSADQYVIDYARIYGLPTVVFRQSCIYGPLQHGNEDQGWVAHFAIRALADEQVTIYGDGFQVRDLLYVGDLLEAYDLAVKHIDTTRGKAYNLGGGPRNAVSIIECIRLLEELIGRPIRTEHDGWRSGDQRAYVSDVRRAFDDFGWAPQVGIPDGLRTLLAWLATNGADSDARLSVGGAKR
jgi:CDP-paratose 2-epimerase